MTPDSRMTDAGIDTGAEIAEATEITGKILSAG
jgi:hypothetical protein